jgi:hypothetical protein
MNTGDWSEMNRLVIARIEDNSKKLDKLSAGVFELEKRMAVLCDRGDRDSLEAKHMALKWGAAISAVVSALMAGLLGAFRE